MFNEYRTSSDESDSSINIRSSVCSSDAEQNGVEISTVGSKSKIKCDEYYNNSLKLPSFNNDHIIIPPKRLRRTVKNILDIYKPISSMSSTQVQVQNVSSCPIMMKEACKYEVNNMRKDAFDFLTSHQDEKGNL